MKKVVTASDAPTQAYLIEIKRTEYARVWVSGTSEDKALNKFNKAASDDPDFIESTISDNYWNVDEDWRVLDGPSDVPQSATLL